MVERLRLEQVESSEFLDTLYALLANATRRNALQYLLVHPGPVSIHRLALELAAVEADTDAEDVTSDQQQELTLMLEHVHLPALSESGVIDWDRPDELVTVTSLFDQLSSLTPDPSGFPGLSPPIPSEKGH